WLKGKRKRGERFIEQLSSTPRRNGGLASRKGTLNHELHFSAQSSMLHLLLALQWMPHGWMRNSITSILSTRDGQLNTPRPFIQATQLAAHTAVTTPSVHSGNPSAFSGTHTHTQREREKE